MDHSDISAKAFHNLAERYREKFMDLTLYDESYQQFCDSLPPGRARVLDAACGPGNVSRYLMKQRPELELLGIDLAPRMVELARTAVPAARFIVHDCRRLADLKMRFDGIICAFGLPYLSAEEAAAFIASAEQSLDTRGVLYLSAMLGSRENSGFVRYDSGDEIYLNYHQEQHLNRALQTCGFQPVRQFHMPSPSVATKRTTDLILIARK